MLGISFWLGLLGGIAVGLGLHIWVCWRLLARMTGLPLLNVLRGGGKAEE